MYVPAEPTPDPLAGARLRLIAAEIPLVHQVRVEYRVVREKTWYRGAVRSEVRRPHSPGWLLGELEWRDNTPKRNEMGLPDYTEQLLTFLPRNGPDSPWWDEFRPVRLCEGGVQTYDRGTRSINMDKATAAIFALLDAPRA